MPAVIRFKRGTLAQLVTAAGAGQLREGEPYHVTDLDMTAVGTGTSSYRFDGVLQLNTGQSVPTGYIGVVSYPFDPLVELATSSPAGLGTAGPGSSTAAARADHVHAKSSVYTFGTAAPSGGADGDLYFQHT
jgi:hypothetical protein